MRRRRGNCYLELQSQGNKLFMQSFKALDKFLFRRTKTDDPEREKLKAKAKEIQRDEAERIRLVNLNDNDQSLKETNLTILYQA